MRLATLGLAGVAWIAFGAAAKADNTPKLPDALASAPVCTDNGRFSMAELVQATLSANAPKSSTLTPKQAIDILTENISIDDPRVVKDPELAQIASYAKMVLSKQWSAYFTPPDPAPSSEDYFTALRDDPDKIHNAWKITCVGQVDNSPATAADAANQTKDTQAGFRLRGSSSDLVPGKGSDALAGASKASFSLGDNQVTKARTGQIVGALGYFQPLNDANTLGVMPYIAGNYNVTKTGAAAAKYSSDTVDGGVYVSGIVHPGHNFVVTLSLAPDYLHNFADGSSIVSLSPVITPRIIGSLNDHHHVTFLDWLPAAVFGPSTPATYLIPFLDLRGDFGHFADRGVGPDVPTNKDFADFGTHFGVDIAKTNWYDLNVTDLEQYGFSGPRRHIYDFESSFTYYGGKQSVLGLTAAYKNGYLERTLQREDAWTIGLTAKY